MDKPLTYRLIFKTWYPLAISWLLMAVEFPFMSAIIARLPHAEINLAAYGGIIFPITFLMQAPVEMLLAASTALSKDWASYTRVRRFMMWLGGVMTALHFLIAFTPLYDLVVERIIHAPVEIIAPARPGLMIMTLFTWCVAYRRFHNGAMIRFGHSRAVAVGTFLRIGVNVALLLIGYALGGIPGVIVASVAQAVGVFAEAVYSGLRVRPVVRWQIRRAQAAETLTWKALVRFYLPLAMTTLVLFSFEFLGSMGMSRMKLPLESLAVWPVITWFIFILQSSGIAYNEVVVALLDKDGARPKLRMYALLLSLTLTAVTLLITATPLATLWFHRVSALTEPLAQLSYRAFWIFLFTPALTVMQSWYQGALLHAQQSQPISEAVIVALVITLGVLFWGIWWGSLAGVYVAALGYTLSFAAQTAWLWYRSRPVLRPAAG
ncbi:MAG: hypothetical protein HPY45_06865 [Anaerolineae bacterium]|nr:hypothetical protein [Anaerolineae bacterium]